MSMHREARWPGMKHAILELEKALFMLD